MTESESSKTVNLCLNFKGNANSGVRELLRDPSRVGHHHPDTLQVMGLVVTSTEQNLEEDSSDEPSTTLVATEDRRSEFWDQLSSHVTSRTTISCILMQSAKFSPAVFVCTALLSWK